ncbi:DUF5667 domain-containing protein [Glycomyces xiaoerkulensis]|uniref:DUF5667 domain-containing protein n=1 Tax=Glycomyces xiaoerkulensis TaxID=2038139 RepID=UPI0012FFD646|nr:DUF5667 domain-containing protein [Glycomyces xiaoerkulensis]
MLNPLERRRADAFASRLDSDPSAHPQPSRSARASGTSDTELAELLHVTERLEDLGEQAAAAAAPSDRWREATRRRLMAVAGAEGIGATARHRASASVPESERPPVVGELFPRRPRGGRRMAIIAALLTGTVAISGVSAASGDALPGETLYEVKRSTERAQLALAGNDLGRGQLHLEFARTRIQEAEAVAGDDEAVARALDDAAGEVRDGTSLLGSLAVERGEEDPLDYVDLFANEHRWALEDLVADLDGEAGEAAEDLLELLESAAVRSVELRESLGCTASGGPDDLLGPLPGECAGPDGSDGAGSGDPGSGETEPDGSEPGSEPGGEDREPEAEVSSDSSADETSDAPEPDESSSPADDEDSGDDEVEDEGVLDDVSGVVSDLLG